MEKYQAEMMQKQIVFAMETLQRAIDICENVDERTGECEKTYAYAAGYSRSAMGGVISDLKNTLKLLAEV